MGIDQLNRPLSNVIKRIAAHLPTRWQHLLRRARSRALIRRGEFHADEPEFDRLPEWLKPGDWALDIGANAGTYTIAMSGLVGEQGRVIALEPIPETFSILISNLDVAASRNVTAINAAASDQTALSQMDVPRFDSGLENFYMARLSSGASEPRDRAQHVLTLAIDSLNLPAAVALVKIDVEGHEEPAVTGMWNLIKRDHPVMILETSSQPLEDKLLNLGYRQQQAPGSPNRVYVFDGA